MKKITWTLLSLCILFVLVSYVLIKINPPLEIGTLASSEGNKSVVVGIGNKGLKKIKVSDTLVNNDEIPADTKIQVSNALQGFIITDNYRSEEAKEYSFMNLDDVNIQPGTSPPSNFKKSDDGTATKDDEAYGISVFHDKEIHTVNIKYSYFGIPFEETAIFH